MRYAVHWPLGVAAYHVGAFTLQHVDDVLAIVTVEEPMPLDALELDGVTSLSVLSRVSDAVGCTSNALGGGKILDELVYTLAVDVAVNTMIHAEDLCGVHSAKPLGDFLLADVFVVVSFHDFSLSFLWRLPAGLNI